jgi:porphyrinogen peroxidase
VGQPQEAIQDGPGRHALFLTLVVGESDADAQQARAVCADLPTLVRSVGQRDATADLSCVVAIGAECWDRLVPGGRRPVQLHAFPELGSGARRAPATPGDVFLHVRASRADFCWELARIVTGQLGSAAHVVDEVSGFAYLDSRDIVGFVDGTENPPRGEARIAATIVGDEDPDHAGGSYVTVQRYVTDLAKWHGTSTEAQEAVIGRTKADDIELDDAIRPATSHVERTKVVRNGEEQKILRHNRVYGTTRESGTLFIAYARDLSVTEEMLERMFVGDPDGTYDHLLDFTRPITGGHFFAPSLDVLESLADAPGAATDNEPILAPASESPLQPAAVSDGSLGVGSLFLRGET